ncbi:hypothetical protein [Sphingomonas sp.]|uniref:hypothetical protein n=1 Tax=Sphingomonas sp. TaxID=28214 RepID=UPI0025ED9B23|nr:hypothetical protein [Sphingomonas sp.]
MFVLVCAMTGISTQAFGQFILPKPEVFVRAEDQQRARFLEKPCASIDEGHGCYRYDGRLIREAPCAYHIEAGVIGFVPTDQCYKMDAPRRYRGVWIDEFEGQKFIPEGTRAPEWPRGNPQSPEWQKKADQAIAATIWLDVDRAKLGHKWQQGGRRVFIEFIGRKTMYPGNYGHMGMSGQEIIVDRVIAQRQCPQIGACR